MAGYANRSASQAQSSPYWSEYKQGYAEAERKIIEAAKQGLAEGKTFLTEGKHQPTELPK
jgi:hypothetical protein